MTSSVATVVSVVLFSGVLMTSDVTFTQYCNLVVTMVALQAGNDKISLTKQLCPWNYCDENKLAH